MASKIKVDNIENQCGGAVVTKCGATTTISGSVVKADDIQAADGGNLINQCGTTITLGASGDTINLASGASQTGFGRTGTVDWDTTAKTASFTAASGNGYFVNTTSGAITVTLPAGSAGDIVSLADYTRTWQTNAVTVSPNGSDKIGGVAGDAILNTEGQSVTFVFTDSTEGWINVQDSTSAVQGRLITPYIIATGGTVTCCGDYKIHTFTGPGTFTVTNEGTPAGSNTLDYLVVAGGGSGGNASPNNNAAGGGAGGFRESSGAASGCYTASPLGACVAALPASFTSYPITVGAGGAKGPTDQSKGNPGSNSIFSTITSTAGGAGGGNAARPGDPGGSGGGGAGGSLCTPFGNGNTPPVSPPQGQPGGLSAPSATGPLDKGGGGGGGATAAGAQGGAPDSSGGPGGAGATTSISASPTAYAGGGGSGNGTGGTGGGGNGGAGTTASNGGTNTGGGGGGSYSTPGTLGGGTGGSGIVVIRYKYQ